MTPLLGAVLPTHAARVEKVETGCYHVIRLADRGGAVLTNSLEDRLLVLEQTVKAYREFMTLIVKLLLERDILSQEELHEGWAGIIAGLKAQEEGENHGDSQRKRPGAAKS